MGYLTTITIRNDGLSNIAAHRDEFAEIVENACVGGSYYQEEYGLGNHANMIIAQRPRHADDPAIYVHMGNTVIEMNAFCSSIQEFKDKHPKFFKRILDFLESEVKELRKKFEE